MSTHPHKPAGTTDPLKYARGKGARLPLSLRPLEWLALIHAGIFIVWLTWGFGGGAEWMRSMLAWWGSLGILITLTALQDSTAWSEGWMRPLAWLRPFVAFNALVLLGVFNPSFREMRFAGEIVLVHGGANPWLPSSARPQLALQALWLFDALWIPAFNLALVVRQRAALRGLLLFAAANAFALSIFGTIQKLAHARGIYFGGFETKQPYFFSSFVYHNHWGAFVLLMLAACLGLVWRYGRRHDARNFLHSPAFSGLVVMLILAASLPLSGSRSATLLASVLLAGGFVHWTVRFARSRWRHHESIIRPLAGAIVALVLAGGSVWYLARETIAQRTALTRDQLGAMLAQGGIGSRSDLYGDTWRMAKDKLWFGWGMASYPHVFTLYNRQTSVDRLPVFYRDAHSDWLQSFAEHGLVGSTLLALCAIVPLLRLRLRHLANPIPAYLLAGCALLLLYAWVEFPFGNLAVVHTWWLCCFCAVQYAQLRDRENPSALAPA